MEHLSASIVAGGGLAAGALFGPVRLEAAAEVSLRPHDAGLLLTGLFGLRLGIEWGPLPFWVELDTLVGLYHLSVDTSGLVIPEGDYLGLALTPSLAVVWRALPWLELLLRPVRFEVLGLTGDLPGGTKTRYALDAALRFRLPDGS
jgi:hypothetical protein